MPEVASGLFGAAEDQGDFETQDLKVTLAHKKFVLKSDLVDAQTKASVKSEVESILKDNNMSKVYEFFCSSLGWKLDQAALDSMRSANSKKVEELDAKVTEVEKNEGDEEIRDAMLAKADYLANIGDKELAWEAYEAVEAKTPSVNHKLTIAFCKMRLEILYGNWVAVKELITTARELCDKGGDWEKKNRLMRQLKRAANLLLDSVATFTTYELFSYEQCVFYAVSMAIVTLPRPDLRKKVVEASEVRAVIDKLPSAKTFLHSLYDCNYSQFFPSFLEVVETLQKDLFLADHVKYYMHEARVVVYLQFLTSYKSVTISAMAKAFGVSETFIDTEVSNLIVAGRLTAKVDKVGSIIETSMMDPKNVNYQALMKQGDLLLNRIQKLSKIVDVE